MKHKISMVLALFLFVGGSWASAQEQSFSYMDIYELQMASSPQISPDGSQIVYLRNQFDKIKDRRYTNLWKISFSGDRHEPLTTGINSIANVSWSPEGNRIAYTSSSEADGSTEIFVRWMETGNVASVTNLDRSPSNIRWSPDGKWLAFTMKVPSEKPRLADVPAPPEGADWAPPAQVYDHVLYRADGAGYLKPGHTHIFLVSAEGGAAKKLTKGDYNYNSYSWTPDGGHIIVSANRSENAPLDPNNTHLFELDVNDGSLQKLTEGRGPHNNPRISPDGKTIAYTGFEDQFTGYQQTDLYLMNRNGKNVRNLTGDFDFSVSTVTWSHSGQHLYFQYTQEGVPKVGAVTRNKNEQIETVASRLASATIGRPYSGGDYSVADNGRFVITYGTAEKSANLGTGVYPDELEITQITNLNSTFLDKTAIGQIQEIWYNSSYDDKRINGWIITPPDFNPDEKYPLILEIHGGPYASYGPQFSPELQLMAAKGYVVIYTNPRGSTSYGTDFASYINNNYPSEDYNDLMDGVDYMLDQGYIDENRLYITGGSGGGVLTAWSIGKTDRFKAAVVAKPVINWFSFALTADMYPFFTKYWFTEMPWEDPMQYFNLSPISLVGNVSTPTMLLTGEQDYRTPISESEQFYQALKLRDVDAAMVRIQSSGHHIAARPSNLIRKVSYILGWFEKYEQ